MVKVPSNIEFYRGRRVFVTGHTGFKGSWLIAFLHELGAEVCGYALEPAEGSLYQQMDGDTICSSMYGDICDVVHLKHALIAFQPEIVLHLAAFGFVSECYEDPERAYRTNILGSQNLLEAVRACDSIRSVVLVSTDKVYVNRGDGASYKEDDPIGGVGPYAGSKTCMEILAEDYRETYFLTNDRKIGLATARASNVLGGGDHIKTRLIPSVLDAVSENRPVNLRNPEQTRPWQYVLDALNGYLTIAKYLYYYPEEYSGAWNIGPGPEGIKSVGWVVDEIRRSFSDLTVAESAKFQIHESETLGLDIAKMVTRTDWRPLLMTEEIVRAVVEFYRRQKAGESVRNICEGQIKSFLEGIVND